MGANATPPDILRGTLDLLILKALTWGPAHGYGVARWIQHATNDALEVGEGTLYPALHRLEERGWISAAARNCAPNPPTGIATPKRCSRRWTRPHGNNPWRAGRGFAGCSASSRKPTSRRSSPSTSRCGSASSSTRARRRNARGNGRCNASAISIARGGNVWPSTNDGDNAWIARNSGPR